MAATRCTILSEAEARTQLSRFQVEKYIHFFANHSQYHSGECASSHYRIALLTVVTVIFHLAQRLPEGDR